MDATTEHDIAKQIAADAADARAESARFARQVRERLGLSQRDFSRHIAVSVETVRRWERGASTPSGATLTLLRLLHRLPAGMLELHPLD